MLGLNPWLSFLAVMIAAGVAFVIAQRAGGPSTASSGASGLARALDLPLEHRSAPLMFGAATSAIVWLAWGGLDRAAVIHDEAAYLLQAELFARGRWAGRAPVLPEFFEQLYVLVTPVLASKYPPGHSLLLSLGALVGLPGLPVVALNGVTGGLVFALARRVCGGRVALLTWLLWVTCFPAIYFRATYLSEVTSSAGWLAAWWCLLHWRRTRARALLLGLAAAVGLVAITRPLTAVALAAPIAVVVLRDTWAGRGWGDVALALGVGVACLALIPIWSARTTGSPLVTPLGLYTRLYMPFDRPGFGVDTAAGPVRSVPPDMALTNRSFYEEHRAHTADALWRTLGRRARMIARDMWYDWRRGLAPFALAALVLLPAAAWFALATLAAHVGLYLLYAHPPFWTVYYLESEPVLALVTALGIVRTLEWAAEVGRRTSRVPQPTTVLQGTSAPGLLALALSMCVLGAMTLRVMRDQINGDRVYFERFDALIRTIPERRAIVFVRYGPAHNDNLSLVRNPVDHAEARVWIVYDRGADNERLLASAPDRRGYLFDEASWTLRPRDAGRAIDDASLAAGSRDAADYRPPTVSAALRR